MLTALCFIGSGLAIAAIAADVLHRHGSPAVQRFVSRFGRIVHFRKSESPVDNLRQALAITGSLLLATLAILTSSPVYCALQFTLTVSALLWYVDVHHDKKRSESIKGYGRLAVAVSVWVALEIFGLCPGFHRVGVLGLEALGCGFIISRPVPRDLFCFVGGALLATYAFIGILVEPDLVAHKNFFILNLIYSALGLIALVDSIRKARLPEVDATAD